MKQIETTFIPGGHYRSKVSVAKVLGIESTSLQYHIKAGRLRTTRCPSGCHMISEEDLLEFIKTRRGPGKPTIYAKEECNL